MNQASAVLYRDPLSDGVTADTPEDLSDSDLSIPWHAGHESRPFSLLPVMRFIVPNPEPGIQCGDRVIRDPGSGEISTVALRLGVSRQWVYRCGHRGLGTYVADAVAIKLGVHPSYLWHDWYIRSDGDFERGPDEDEFELRVGPCRERTERTERTPRPLAEPTARAINPFAYRPIVNPTAEDRRAMARIEELSHIGPYRLVGILADEGFANPRTGMPWTKNSIYNLKAAMAGLVREPKVRTFECRRCGVSFEKVGNGRPAFCPECRERPKVDRQKSPCGTRTAYNRHLREGTPTCADCREANRLHSIEYQRRRTAESVGAA